MKRKTNMTYEMRLKNCDAYNAEDILNLGTKGSKVEIRGVKA